MPLRSRRCIAELFVIGVAITLVLWGAAAAQSPYGSDGIDESVQEILAFVDGLAYSRLWPLLAAGLMWGFCLFLLISSTSSIRARSPALEWLVLLGMPILVGLLAAYGVAHMDAAQAPQFACDDVGGRLNDIPDAFVRERVRRGTELCRLADKTRLSFALETGQLTVLWILTLTVVGTLVVWWRTTVRIVTGRYVT